MKMNEEEMKIKKFRGLAPGLKPFFVLLCVTVIGMASNAEVFASDVNRVDLLKSEVGYIDHGDIDTVPADGGINGDSGNKKPLADDPFQYALSQNDKGEETIDNENEEADGAEEQSDVKGNAHGMVFEPTQFCQGKFKRLGGTGVEIITIRCPRVDDSCNCEGEKKSQTKWVECGGVRKDSTIGSDLLSCESKIVGSGVAPSSE
jgi:hypothetical protein